MFCSILKKNDIDNKSIKSLAVKTKNCDLPQRPALCYVVPQSPSPVAHISSLVGLWPEI